MNDVWSERVNTVKKVNISLYLKNDEGVITRKDFADLDPSVTLNSLGINKENSEIKIFSLSRDTESEKETKALEWEDGSTLKEILKNSTFTSFCCHRADCPNNFVPRLEIYKAKEFPNELNRTVHIGFAPDSDNPDERRKMGFSVRDNVKRVRIAFFHGEDTAAEVFVEGLVEKRSSLIEGSIKFVEGIEPFEVADDQLLHDVLKLSSVSEAVDSPNIYVRITPKPALSNNNPHLQYSLPQMLVGGTSPNTASSSTAVNLAPVSGEPKKSLCSMQ